MDDRFDGPGPAVRVAPVGALTGCLSELESLLANLGWLRDECELWEHPEGRRLIFLGDLACGGPRSLEVVERNCVACHDDTLGMTEPGTCSTCHRGVGHIP